MVNHNTTPLPARFRRPHVVILGAGASRAAFPEGDANGRVVPLMSDLVAVLELESLFEDFALEVVDRNFETLYSTISMAGTHPGVVAQIEARVFEYFSSFSLPDEPTLYDRLVLSLRPKDLIATFNWDPFLWEALNRNASYAPMPQVIHLHGNVAVGHCTRHTPMSEGWRGRACRRCGTQFVPSRLLFPVCVKNYTKDPAIAISWEVMERAMKNAYLLTIFGYRAPDTDVEAVQLLKNGWGNQYSRSFEEIEIIDVRHEDDLRATWRNFLHTHHYHVVNSFDQSVAGHFPRRSCEAEWERLMECNEDLWPQPMPDYAGWSDLHAWVRRLLDQESEFDRESVSRETAHPSSV